MKKKETTDQSNTPKKTDNIQQNEAPEDAVVCNCTNDVEQDIQALRAQVDQLQKELEETKNSYLRALADFDNYKKRQREDVLRQVSWGKESLLLQIIAIADNLERALEASQSHKDPDALLEGLNLILRQMQDLLRKEGIEPIDAEGQEFNPELHEAIMRDSSGDYPENTVIEEFQKGYTFDGRVIRPSKVKVSVEG